MTVYTIVAYRPNTYDSRREESWGSDHRIQFFENLEETIQCIFQYKVVKKECIEYNDDDWETTILIDGRGDDFWHDDQKEQDPRFWDIEEKARDLFDEWLTKAKEREEQAKKEAAAKAEREKRAAAARVVAAEKKLLQELRAKYGI